MRKCSNCFKFKPLSDFYIKRPSSYQSRCKACNPEVVRAYYKNKFKKEFSAWVKGTLIIVFLFSSISKALEVDFDREQVTCGRVTYQFDFKYSGDRRIYDRVENYWNVTSERDASTDHDVCEILFKYFCNTSAPFKKDNPQCF